MTRTLNTQVNRPARRLATVAALGATLIATAFAAGPAEASSHQSKVRFGSKLAKNVQPSNSLPAKTCPNPSKGCMWLMREGYHPGGGLDKSPRKGTIRRLRVIAGGPGSFRPLIARVREGSNRSKVIRRGKRLKHEGQESTFSKPYEVETFKVRIPVRKGDRLGIQTKSTSMVRCSSGGPNTLIYQPLLALRAPFAKPHDSTGCWLLIEAVVR